MEGLQIAIGHVDYLVADVDTVVTIYFPDLVYSHDIRAVYTKEFLCR